MKLHAGMPAITRSTILAFQASLVLLQIPVMAQPAPGAAVTLRDAANEALSRNHGIRALQSRVSASEQVVDRAHSRYFPRLDLEEIFTNGDDPVYVFGTLLKQGEFGPRNFDVGLLNNPPPLNNFTHRITLSQLIYDGGKVGRSVSLARLESESKRLELSTAEQQILFDVIRAYYGVLLADETLRVARENLHVVEADLDRSRNRSAVGMALKSDVMRLEVQSADFKRVVLSARGEARITRRELEVLLGRAPEGRIQPSDRLTERIFTPPPLAELEISSATHRPDLKRADLSVKMARDRSRDARGNYYPTVGFLGSYEFNNGTSTGLGNQYLLGIQVKFNLFDAGAKSAAIRETHAVRQAAEYERRELENRARLEIEQSFERQQVALEQYRVAKQSVSSSEESLRIIRDRLNEGLATVTDLLSVESARFQSQLAATRALSDYHVAFAALEKAAGILTPQSQFFSKP